MPKPGRRKDDAGFLDQLRTDAAGVMGGKKAPVPLAVAIVLGIIGFLTVSAWVLAVAAGLAALFWFLLLAFSSTRISPRRRKIGVVVGVVLLAATAGTSALAVIKRHSAAHEQRFEATAPVCARLGGVGDSLNALKASLVAKPSQDLFSSDEWRNLKASLARLTDAARSLGDSEFIKATNELRTAWVETEAPDTSADQRLVRQAKAWAAADPLGKLCEQEGHPVLTGSEAGEVIPPEVRPARMCGNMKTLWAIVWRDLMDNAQPGDEQRFNRLARKIQSDAANLIYQSEKDSRPWRLAWSTIRWADALAQHAIPVGEITVDIRTGCAAFGVRAPFVVYDMEGGNG